MDINLSKASKTPSFLIKTIVFSFFSHQIPHPIEQICLILEYIQLFALTIISTHQSTENPDTDFPSLPLSIANFFCSGYLIQLQDTTFTRILIFFLIVCVLFILKYMFIAYTLYIALQGRKLQPALSKLWSWIFLCQGRVIFLVIGSLCVNVAQSVNELKDTTVEWGNVITVVCVSIITIEFFVCFVQQKRFGCCIPTKEFLASKSNQSETITLTQKYILLLMILFMPTQWWVSSMAFAVVNFILTISRHTMYLKALSPYRPQTVYYEAFLFSTATALAVCCLIRAILELVYDNLNMDGSFILVVWFILTVLFVKINFQWVTQRTAKICYGTIDPNFSAEILLQKISAIKQIRKRRKQCAPNSPADKFYLLFSAITKNNSIFFELNHPQLTSNSTARINLDDKEATNHLFASYLETVVSKHPRYHLAKLYLAYYYGIKLKMYGSALKLLRDIEQSCSANMAYNVFFLRNKMQDNIKIKGNKTDMQLDLYDFVRHTQIVDDLKEKMITQADSQIKLCQEHSQKTPDLAKILEYSQEIEHHRQSMSKKIRRTLQNIPDCFLEPLLVSAYYHLRLNFSTSGSFRAYEAFSKKYKRYEHWLKADKLCQENLYDKNKVLFVMKTHMESLGSIVSCSKSSDKILSWKNYDLARGNLGSFMPPVLAEYYYERLRTYIQKEGKYDFKDIVRSFALNKYGYLMPVDYYFGLHPFITEELYLDLIMRPVPDSKEYLIVDKNGIIQGFTEGISKKLNLKRYEGGVQKAQGTNIGSLSHELRKLNKACDVVASQRYAELHPNENNTIIVNDKKGAASGKKTPTTNNTTSRPNLLRGISTVDAQALFDAYHTESHPLIISSIKKPASKAMSIFEDSEHIFHCKVDLEMHNMTYVKIFSFEETEEGVYSPKKALLHKQTTIFQAFSPRTPAGFASPRTPGGFPNPQTPGGLASPGKESGIQHVPCFTETHSAEIKSDCEKEAGWIDLHKLGSDYDGLFSPHRLLTYEKDMMTQGNHGKEDSNFLSVKFMFSARDGMMPPQHGILAQENVLTKEASHGSHTERSSELPDGKAAEEIKAAGKNHAANALKIRQSLVGSQHSNTSEQERVENMFSDALNVRFYPSMYKLFIPVLYAFVLALFIIKITTQVKTNVALNTLAGRRVILQNAEGINSLLSRIHRNLRLMKCINEGTLNETAYTPLGVTTSALRTFIITNLPVIAKNNLDLFSATSSISSEDQEKIFTDNIPVYESNYEEPDEQSHPVNTFQATNRVYESGSKAMTIAKVNVTNAVPEFGFILRNGVNDFFLTSRKTSDLFLALSQKEVDQSLAGVVRLLIGIEVCLFLTMVWSGVVIAKQYKSEIRNLNAYVNINDDTVRHVLAKIVEFRTLLVEGGSFEYVRPIAINEFADKFAKAKPDKVYRRESLEQTNNRGILLKYLFKFLGICAVLLVLAACFIAGYLQKKDAFNFMITKLSQCFVLQRVSSNINLASTAYIELFTMNNTTLVLDEPSSQAFDEIIQTINSINTLITDTFQDTTDNMYDQIIQKVLFDDGCNLLPTQTSFARCALARQGRNTVSVLNLVSDVSAGLRLANDYYKQSNKTDQVLRQLMFNTFGTIFTPNRAVSDLLNFTSYTLDQGFNEAVIDVQRNNDIFDVSIEIVIVVSGVVIWVAVLGRLIEAENRFKKVLKTLPEDIIMSSFVLKAYLFRTSKSYLDSLKNKI